MPAAQSRELLPDEAEVDLTLPIANAAEMRAQFEVLTAQESDQGFRCPRCGADHRKGELVCANCGVLFANGGKTDKLDSKSDILAQPRQWPIGQVFAGENKRIYLQINNQCIDLPDKASIVIGRAA